MLLPQAILLGVATSGVDHEVASTFAEVWTVLSATGFKEADGGVVRGVVADGLGWATFTIRNVVVRSHGGSILATVFRVIFDVSVKIH